MAIMRHGLLSLMKDSNDKRKAAYYIERGIKRPEKKKSTRPLTEKQLAQRLKFGLASKFVTEIKFITAIGFQHPKKRVMSPTNVALQAVMKESIVGDYPNLKIDYERVRISAGQLLPALSYDLKWVQPDVIGVAWENIPRMVSDDRFLYHLINILLYDEKGEQAMIALIAGRRGDCKLEIIIPQYLTGAKLHCWVFFSTENQRMVSNSQYLGALIRDY